MTLKLRFKQQSYQSDAVRAVATILGRINAAVFGQYKTNPEDFIRQASTIINEQKATVIVEHLARV